MTEKEVIDHIGLERWEEFYKFMYGQTVGVNEDGSFNYYDCDVENFLRHPKDRFFD